MYSTRVLEHFQNPRNWGEIPDPDGVATIGEDCGDVFKFFIKVKDNRLVQVRYQVKGCPVAIACCSVTAVLAEGKTIWEAMQITNEEVEKALGGLPPEKLHCSNLAADALYAAIQDYLYRLAEKGVLSSRNLSGESWRLAYVQAQKGARPLPCAKGGIPKCS
ncbi:MAG: iron-sulfur cluster assembly scaffold protein [Firmicutes bacterium]|nr:iron-sulfur cluster assembly scaffold protein [Bacillota bacterium]